MFLFTKYNIILQRTFLFAFSSGLFLNQVLEHKNLIFYNTR